MNDVQKFMSPHCTRRNRISKPFSKNWSHPPATDGKCRARLRAPRDLAQGPHLILRSSLRGVATEIQVIIWVEITWCSHTFMATSPSYTLRGPVGVVIAHPDDESMFFTPALTAMERRGERAFVLCLSTGDGFSDRTRSGIPSLPAPFS